MRQIIALLNLTEDSVEVGGPDWEEVKEIYASARELTGMFVMTDEGPLDMRNPWDPPDNGDAAMA